MSSTIRPYDQAAIDRYFEQKPGKVEERLVIENGHVTCRKLTILEVAFAKLGFGNAKISNVLEKCKGLNINDARLVDLVSDYNARHHFFPLIPDLKWFIKDAGSAVQVWKSVPEGKKVVVEKELQTFQDELFMQTVSDGNVKEMKRLYKQGFLESRNQDMQTPLMLAIRNKHKEAALQLIAWGSDVEAKDPSGRNCLFLAMEAGDPDVIRALQSKGCTGVSDVISPELATAKTVYISSLTLANSKKYLELLKKSKPERLVISRLNLSDEEFSKFLKECPKFKGLVLSTPEDYTKAFKEFPLDRDQKLLQEPHVFIGGDEYSTHKNSLNEYLKNQNVKYCFVLSLSWNDYTNTEIQQNNPDLMAWHVQLQSPYGGYQK